MGTKINLGSLYIDMKQHLRVQFSTSCLSLVVLDRGNVYQLVYVLENGKIIPKLNVCCFLLLHTFMLENSVHTDAKSWEALHYPLWEPSVHGLHRLIIPAREDSKGLMSVW